MAFGRVPTVFKRILFLTDSQTIEQVKEGGTVLRKVREKYIAVALNNCPEIVLRSNWIVFRKASEFVKLEKGGTRINRLRDSESFDLKIFNERLYFRRLRQQKIMSFFCASDHRNMSISFMLSSVGT